MKSSAVSVWIFPVMEGRDNVPILPSGVPVEKTNESAAAGGATASKPPKVAVRAKTVLIELIPRNLGLVFAGVIFLVCIIILIS